MDGTDSPVRPSVPGRIWGAPLLVHVLLLAVVLVGVAAATSQPDSFTTDEGSYEVQLRALDQGSWVWDSGTEQLDPSGKHYPVVFSSPTDDGFVPLAKHPLWPWAAAQAATVVGTAHAYDVLGSLAVVALAVAAWFLAAVHDPRASRGAFWIAALGPVTVTATFGWAHAAGAAAAGFAVLGAALAVRGVGAGRGQMVLAGGLIAAGVAVGILVRTEGLLLAIALAGGLVVGGRRAGRSWAWSALSGAAVLVWSAGILKAEDLWVRSIVGTGSTTLSAPQGGGVAATGFVDGRIQGAIGSLLDPRGRGFGLLVLAAAVFAAVAAALVVRGNRAWLARWHVGMVLVALAFTLRALAASDTSVRGMLVAWPIVVVGVAAAGAWLWGRLAMEAVVVVLFAGAILATQYADGGAVQWGGRFFAVVAVPLAVVAALGLQRVLQVEGAVSAEDEDEAEAADRLPLGRVVTAAVVVIPLVLGTWICANARAFLTDTFTEVDARIEGVAVTPDEQLPRMMWRYGQPWLVVSATDHGDDLTETLASLRTQPDGPDRVTLVVRQYDLEEAPRALERFEGWTEVRRSDANGLTVINLER